MQQLLLMARMLFKCEMLSAQVREKFAPAEKWDASSIKSPVAEQFSFGSRLLHLLLSIQVRVRYIFTQQSIMYTMDILVFWSFFRV